MTVPSRHLSCAGAPARPRVCVCGHRNPDADSIASALGYAELERRAAGSG